MNKYFIIVWLRFLINWFSKLSKIDIFIKKLINFLNNIYLLRNLKIYKWGYNKKNKGMV